MALTGASWADCFHPTGLEIACHCCKLLIYNISHCFPFLPFPSPPSPGQEEEEEYEQQTPHGESSSVTYVFFFHLGAVLKQLREFQSLDICFQFCLYVCTASRFLIWLPDFPLWQTHTSRCLSLAENLVSSYRIHSCGQVSFYTHFAAVLEHLVF